ncbi:phosphatase, partial [Acinetobacter baumannii]
VPGCSSGMCKCQMLGARAVPSLKVVIGDGRSDFCWSAQADLVYAKGKLLAHCKRIGISHVAFEDFHDIRMSLQQKLDGL